MLSTKTTGVVPVMDMSNLSKVIDPAGQLPNKPVPGAKEYYPLNEPEIGSALSDVRPLYLKQLLPSPSVLRQL